MSTMMSRTLTVWRELLAGAREGRRQWPSVSMFAREIEMPVSTTHRALKHPVEIGAVEVTALGGLVLLDPYRLLILFAAHRRLQRDVVEVVHLNAPVHQVEEHIHGQPGCVLGGFSAAIYHAGGNFIADYSTVLVYGPPMLEGLGVAPPGAGSELLIAEGDPLVGRHGPVTTFAQTWADLFCLPGWQAARFVEELDAKEVAGRVEPVLLL
jgi:hypothetical protein